MAWERLIAIGDDKPMAGLFTGQCGGTGQCGMPISTPVIRRATHWEDVVAQLGYEHLRHTGLTWVADAGIPIHVVQKIAGHPEVTTTQRHLHPSARSVSDAGQLLSDHILTSQSPHVVPKRRSG